MLRRKVEKDPLVTNMEEASSDSGLSADRSSPGVEEDNTDFEMELLKPGTSKTHAAGVTLSWKNVNVNTKDNTTGCMPGRKSFVPSKQILKNVSGVVQPGTLLVIMGASGSGKTTLLNMLNGRNLDGLETEGEVRVNGKMIGDDINSISSYVQQMDMFIGTLTVYEHLLFNAILQMDRNTSEEERNKNIESVIFELGLTKCRDTQIGIPGLVKGLSGGEQKRLAFASAVITGSSLIFCDEPTSGLDSFMAQNVVEVLKDMANKGRTILTTIHQPSSQCFDMFDQILLMSEGRVAYMGPTKELTAFFASINLECPLNFNPADYCMEQLAIAPGRESECRDFVRIVSDNFEKSSYQRAITWEIQRLSHEKRDTFLSDMENIHNKKTYTDMEEGSGSIGTEQYKSDRWTQFKWLTWRQVIDIKRNPRIMPARIIQMVIQSLILGLLYFQITYDQTGIANVSGCMFMMTVQCSFNVCFTVSAGFLKEYPLFLREHADRMYRVTPYYISKIICDYPVFLVGVAMYTTIAYWMIGLYPGAAEFFICMAALMLMAMTATAFAHFMAASVPNPQLTMALVSPIMGLALMFAGIFLKDDSVSKVFLIIQVISPFRYCYETLIVNQWRHVDHLDCEYLDYMQNNNVTIDPEEICATSGEDVIQQFQYNDNDISTDFFANLGLFLALEVIGLAAMVLRARKR